MQATIALEYSNARTAGAMAKAVSPDNFKKPAGLSIKTYGSGNSVITEIRAEEKFATFIATIDDLLFSASTAEKAILITKEK